MPDKNNDGEELEMRFFEHRQHHRKFTLRMPDNFDAYVVNDAGSFLIQYLVFLEDIGKDENPRPRQCVKITYELTDRSYRVSPVANWSPDYVYSFEPEPDLRSKNAKIRNGITLKAIEKEGADKPLYLVHVY